MEGFCQEGDQIRQKPDEAVETDQNIAGQVKSLKEGESANDTTTMADEYYGDTGENKLNQDLRITLININIIHDSIYLAHKNCFTAFPSQQ